MRSARFPSEPPSYVAVAYAGGFFFAQNMMLDGSKIKISSQKGSAQMPVSFQIGDVVTYKENSERLAHRQSKGWIKARDENIGEIVDKECDEWEDTLYTIKRRIDGFFYRAKPSEIQKIDE